MSYRDAIDWYVSFQNLQNLSDTNWKTRSQVFSVERNITHLLTKENKIVNFTDIIYLLLKFNILF